MHPWSDIRRGIPFRLLQGETLLGTLAVHEAGREWLVCAFAPAVAFPTLGALFDTASGVFADPTQQPVGGAAWAGVRAALAAHGVRVGTGGGATDRFLLHIDGQKAAALRPARRSGAARCRRVAGIRRRACRRGGPGAVRRAIQGGVRRRDARRRCATRRRACCRWSRGAAPRCAHSR
ncbi:MAG: hypothetical protein U0232_01370 [Thermomicrobiales bacterium]